ncbi:MAG TPA: hypothetical protein VGN72_02245 [Tepidisphaeraceae bacterium]|nr:hypothetical protein [Tepidisphaeraceae bacterium]
MAKYEPPAHIEIAALRAQQVQDIDLMASGPGIPWEDRGTHGPVSGFFKTAGQSLSKPAHMYSLLRRPNTTGDARNFIFACGTMWSLGALLHGIVTATGIRGGDAARSSLLPYALLIIAAPFVLYGLMSIATGIFSTIIESELKKGTPRSLATNVFAYAAGPSVLAPLLLPIHWAGAAIVVLWMTVTVIVGARTRMRLSVTGGTIGAVLSMAAIVGITVGAYFGLNRLWWIIS